jgi:hypothetical protein
MLDKAELVQIRDAVAGDANFVFSTWLKGLRFGNPWFGLIDSKIYYATYHKVIEALLGKTTIKVACLKEDPGVILGYAVYHGTRLDWVHVKKSWRNIGLAKDLVPKEITSVSHVTEIGRNIIKKRGNIVFDPFTFN